MKNREEVFIKHFNFLILCLFICSGCNDSSAVFCENLSEEYKNLLEQDQSMKIHSWNNLYIHHTFLAQPLLEEWKKNSVEKERFFSLIFYAFLRSQSALECGMEPKKSVLFSGKQVQKESAGLMKMDEESHSYFECLFSEWKEHAKPLIFKSCKYYLAY